MGVLVDVEQDGHIQLGGPVRSQPAEVRPEGKAVQTL
jgi:hypothetical protein